MLHRKLTSETVEPLRYRMEDPSFTNIPRKLARFAEDAGPMFNELRPHAPAALHDRAKDNWDPLFAIADMAGGAWPAKARRAALVLSRESGHDESAGLQLLRAVREWGFTPGEDRVATSVLLERLNAVDGAPWRTPDGGLTDRQLSRMLYPYEVRPTKLRISGGSPVQGYLLKSVENACVRYLKGNRDEASDGDTGTVDGGAGAPDRAAEHATSGTDKPLKRKGCSGVPANRDIDTIDMEEIWNRPVSED